MGSEVTLAAKAAETLRHLGDHASADSALAQIANGLQSPSVIERRATVRWIQQIGGRTALVFLQSTYENDPDLAVRTDAGKALRVVTESLAE